MNYSMDTSIEDMASRILLNKYSICVLEFNWMKILMYADLRAIKVLWNINVHKVRTNPFL